MIDINFKVDPDKLTLRDLVAFEDMQLSDQPMHARDVVNLVARFLVDEKGEPVEMETARNVILDLSVTKANEAADKLMQTIREVSSPQVPPE